MSKIIERLLLILLVMVFLPFQTVAALTQAERDNFTTPFFDPDGRQCSGLTSSVSGSTPTNLLANAKQIKAFSAPKITPTAIILHWTAGEYSDGNQFVEQLKSSTKPDSVGNEYPNGRSVQLTIDKEGIVYLLTETLDTRPMQTMPDQTWNDATIGIEIESSSFAGDQYPYPQHEKDLLDNQLQYEVVLGVVRELMAQFTIKNEADLTSKKGIFGHYEAAPNDKSDPGPNYMAKVRAALNASSTLSASTSSSGNCSCTTLLPGTDNPQKIWNFLIGKGLSAPQIAGIMGNIQTESAGTWDPRVVEFGYPNSQGITSVAGKPETWDDEVPPDTNSKGQPGYGLVQWTDPGYKQGLRDFAKERGTIGGDLGTQLEYLWKQLSEPGLKKSVLDPILATDDYIVATNIFLDKYERPGSPEKTRSLRQTQALDLLTQFGTTDPATSSGTTSSANCGGSGIVNADGYSFPVAPQRKSENSKVPAMSPLPCGEGTNCHGERGVGVAFDIGRQPGGDSTESTPVYAISDGTITSVQDRYDGNAGCFTIQLSSSTDNFKYAYLHIKNPLVTEGQTVVSGQQLAEIGPRKCARGTDPHLHIDRGCIKNGVPQNGGSPSCRDGTFKDLMNAIFNGLPE